jgi:hypothetical protein
MNARNHIWGNIVEAIYNMCSAVRQFDQESTVRAKEAFAHVMALAPVAPDQGEYAASVFRRAVRVFDRYDMCGLQRLTNNWESI